MMPVIEAEGLYKIFGRKPARGVEALKAGTTREQLREDKLTAAVIDASFNVEPGEIFVVMGLSGSGKSTLIRMVNGLLDATAGELRIDGRALTEMSEEELRQVRRDKISMVFQNFALLPHRTVGENAAYGLEVKGISKSEREERAEEALSMVGLGGWGDSRPDQLSGGMKQRVGLARALATGSDILLMDEAFSALDPLIRKDMQDQLMELQSRLDKTILFITHDLNEAMRLGDRVAMMRDGRIEQVGTAEQILKSPANDYVSRFVQDVDRTRVLTAGNITEPPPETLMDTQGPRVAHKLLRETQNSWLVVVDRHQRPVGVLWQDDIAAAVNRDSDELPWSRRHDMPVVNHRVPIAELFTKSAENDAPLVVVDDEGKFLGVVPRVTLLAALGTGQQDDSEADQTTEGTPK